MFNVLKDTYLAYVCYVPFKEAYNRLRCIRKGHVKLNAVLLDELKSYNHPASDSAVVYTVEVLKCPCCGSVFLNPELRYNPRKN
jgi:hypothetical protein